ncbi:hypothetical protein [Undibacterium terreum]|uniref:Uncharacterized protein n=1 Tax=Undibacterium terreum TaxID=1224302 RepID=A0A916XNN0_9BURK|nr:hypothetical protein [Undibacterium terreum]GGC87758.1 hypothetical protein GCM10011396_38730 [Undibacterium terreum]
MSVYKISYANKGKFERIKFEHECNYPLSHYEIVCIAARHKMQSEIVAIGLMAPPDTPELLVQTNVQIMDLADIEFVEFIIEGTTHIQCVPSVWRIGSYVVDDIPEFNPTRP